jgi:hypothetical protein
MNFDRWLVKKTHLVKKNMMRKIPGVRMVFSRG